MGRWDRLTIYQKLILIFILVVIVPSFLMGIFLFREFSENLKKSLISSTLSATYNIGNNVSDIYSGIDKATKKLYEKQNDEYDYFYQLFEDEKSPDKKTLLTKQLRAVLNANNHIDSVYFIDRNGEIYDAMHPPESVVSRSLMTNWHKDNYIPDKKTLTIIPRHESTYFIYKYEDSISFARNIYSTKSIDAIENEWLGTVYIDIDVQTLDNIIYNTTLDMNNDLLIYSTAEKRSIYSDEGTGEGGMDAGISNRFMEANAYFLKDQYYYVYSKVDKTDLVVVSRIPKSEIMGKYHNAIIYASILYATVIGLLLSIYLLVTNRIRDSLGMVMNAMRQIQNGKFDTRLEVKSKDEIGVFSEALNTMTENMQRYISEVYKSHIKQKEAQLNALKMQIRPHYLYNTLEVIRMTALSKRDEITADMLTLLSNQMKYTIEVKEKFVTLQQEIENVTDYFRLVNLRYKDKFELEINVPVELYCVSLPHLVLQPLIENAIEHGLKPKAVSGFIEIRAEGSKNVLKLEIIDNGIGMDSGKLEKIKSLLDNLNRKETDGEQEIGVMNVHERIRLNYGEMYGLELSSMENVGTKVKIEIPIQRRAYGNQNTGS